MAEHVVDSGDGMTPAELLAEVQTLRQRARTTRHSYWFPLVLFGLLTALVAPLYAEPQIVPGSDPNLVYDSPAEDPWFRLFAGRWHTGSGSLGWYWLVALIGGFALTVWWYRRQGQRTGLQTPTRGYLIAGVAGTAVAVWLPFAAGLLNLWLGTAVFTLPVDLLSDHGTGAFLIVAVGLIVLARLERTIGLAVIAGVYLVAVLLANLYDLENLVFELGWTPQGDQWRFTELPNVLLPAAILLIGGAIAFFTLKRTATVPVGGAEDTA